MSEALNHLLDFPDLHIERYHFDQDATLYIEVRPIFPVAVCPDCKTVSGSLHHYDEQRQVRDCSVWGTPCYLVWRPRRFDCARCGNPSPNSPAPQNPIGISRGAMSNTSFAFVAAAICHASRLWKV